MDSVLMVLGGVVGIGSGAALGFLLGCSLITRPSWLFWVASVIFTIVGVGLAFLGKQWSYDALFVGGIGFMGGALTALKYGAHKVPAFPVLKP
ncbi:MAG: hypothetical protein KJ747_01115 [Actinobacteria bacterium]|nr:hypothetical protein [Actinomycetota bacterium]MCG2807715.1 hypothetical protein [Coriobacteriia bacterium]MDP2234004.1 hypothetical protein [Actinomycetota bacterium]